MLLTEPRRQSDPKYQNFNAVPWPTLGTNRLEHGYDHGNPPLSSLPHNLTPLILATWPLIISSHHQQQTKKNKNIKIEYELSSISWIVKELREGGIHKEQEYDFYISSSEKEQCIRYLQEKKKKKKKKNKNKNKAKTVHAYKELDPTKQMSGP